MKTNTNTTTNQTITGINSVLMAKLSRKIPSTSQRLKVTSAQIAVDAHADPKAARAFATTINRKGTAVGKAASIINSLSKDIHALALPCPSIKGAVYVKATDADRVIELFDDAAIQLEGAKREIHKEWPSLIYEAEIRLGNLNSEIQWPSADEFISGYVLKLDWLGIPAPVENTVLEAVSSEVASRVRASSEKSVKDMMRTAHGKPVRDLVTLLNESVQQIRKGTRIRQERFDNISEAIKRCEDLNWLGIPELKSLCRNMRNSCTVDDAPSLTKEERNDAATRIEVAKANAESTLSKLGI